MESLDDLLQFVHQFVMNNYDDFPEEIKIRTRNGKKISLPVPASFHRKSAPAAPTKPTCRHSEDYRSVHWMGTQYQFSERQAAVVQRLWEAWEDGTPELSTATLLEAAESDCDRLRDLFRSSSGNHPAWPVMFQSGSRRGTYRLSLPD
jgi:ketosteroid isomerase-like protein